MRANYALLMTDLVDSTALTERMGEDASAALWLITIVLTAICFARIAGARWIELTGSSFFSIRSTRQWPMHWSINVRFAISILHCRPEPVSTIVDSVQENAEAEVTRGAKRFEAAGIAIATVARVMSTAKAGRHC